MGKTIFVYENFKSSEPVLMGRLYVDEIRGKESFSFEFDSEWIAGNRRLFLDPNLTMAPGRQYQYGETIFGVFSDLSPDRWGRVLMDRKERFAAEKENRRPRKLMESDYLLGVYDKTRMGAIRLKTSPDGEFLSSDKETAVPPWALLRKLENAVGNYEKDTGFAQEKWINQLIMPGSSLGGTRPKATVQDQNGELWIAKFPSRKDTYDIGAWEKTVNDLAGLCGLDVPLCGLEKLSENGSTFLVKRFDRRGENRIHFASAMTMLGMNEASPDIHGAGYADIADFLKAYSAEPIKDTVELWRRIVFNMAITNTDDHLRNHGFLLKKGRWRLSPLYDVNPSPYGDMLSLSIDGNTADISFDAAIDCAVMYGISKDDAVKEVKKMTEIIKDNWRYVAGRNKIRRAEADEMASAFEICERWK